MNQDTLFAQPKVPEGVTQMDCVEWLSSLPPESIDLIMTDPAYESLEKHRVVGTTTRLKKAWFPVVPNSYFQEFFAQCFRVLKPNTHLYVMCDQETMFAIKPIGESAGFKFWKPIVWSKMKMGMGYHYRNSCEFILFFEKGKRKLNDFGVRDVLEVQSIRDREAYPTEKPVELLEILIKQSSDPGEIVIDPFCGSGSTGHAALNQKRRFAGCDVVEWAAHISNARIGLFGDTQ